MGKKALYAEQELVVLLKDNNPSGFDYLYENYSAPLYGIVLKIVKSEDNAADVLQDTFLKIWKNIGSYQPEKGTLFTWILNVARNTAIDKLRGEVKLARMIKLHAVPEHELNSKLAFYPAAANFDIKQLVDNLLPERRTLIDLVYFQGYTHEEASEYLCLPLGTVKSRVRKALQDLRGVFALRELSLYAN
ncbi:RNA polymerase sigma factor [Dyadobacter crusticola]|uniref:RNA polymerase sigma factor n=1 Tax=Dyadobacter crusticola TaxID=292407 RepID=UPI0004E0E05D|nr:RNA polymerase sigma factor [Dyadobacter crusticola]